jgi:hypothetical protein
MFSPVEFFCDLDTEVLGAIHLLERVTMEGVVGRDGFLLVCDGEYVALGYVCRSLGYPELVRDCR